jgi:cytochrome P450
MEKVAALFQPSCPRFRADPYPTYRRLREAAPICYRPEQDDWLLTRYADVKFVMQDARFHFHDPERIRPVVDTDWAETANLEPSARKIGLLRQKCIDLQWRFLNLQRPPQHTRLRHALRPTFEPARLDRMRPRIQQIADALVDRAEAAGAMDVVADFFLPLTFTVICDILGCPTADRERIRGWTRDLVDSMDFDCSRAARERGIMATAAFAGYLHHLLGQRLRMPRPDLLSALAQAQRQGDIGADDLLANSIVLLFAGHETTTNFFGLAIWNLLRQPQPWDMLRQNPDAVATAVEELLRYDGPVQLQSHVALEDVTVADRQIKKGQRLHLLIGAANRDPAQFPDPDRLDLTRQPNPHLAFFHGIHHCLGAGLARLEAEVALRTLLRRLPNLALVDEPPHRLDTYFMRGFKSLRVAW